MTGRWELTDEQWAVMEPVLRPQRREDNRGRPWHDTRAVLNGVFWVLGTGAQWRELPEKYPPYQTCHRRFQQWIRSGKLEEALKRLARHLHGRGRLNLEEAFVDATFASAKKGASPSAPPVAAREPRSSLSPLITVFLSPYLSRALRLPSASLLRKFLPEAFSTNSRPGSSATKPTTRTRSTRSSLEDYGVERLRRTDADANAELRMAASCAVIENAGKWSVSLPGCTTSAASSPDGNHKLDQVKAVAVEEWLDNIKRAKGTKAKIRNLMSALFTHAMRYEWVDRNPIKLVRQSAKRERIPDVLELQEIQLLLQQTRCQGTNTGIARRRNRASGDRRAHRFQHHNLDVYAAVLWRQP
ncbi:MAG TPA: transposase [Terracidiphilus sp.]|nr:transposase [Terracidiphilus sp.]